jgi:N-acetylglucosaminyldiphosphoundecaprenol N-acetyl-beta-D-mannosaminyltransferase
MAHSHGQALGRKRVALFGMHFDAVRLDEAVAEILGWAAESAAPLRYVVTPNVQHVLLFQRNPEFRRAYEQASLVLVDGTPLVWAASYLGSPVPERVAGSDLLPTLLAAVPASRPLSLFLLGAASEVAERAGRFVEQQYPAVRVAGVYSPPFGFERDDRENADILKRIEQAAPEILVIGLGAPKQELWKHRFRADHSARVDLPRAAR